MTFRACTSRAGGRKRRKCVLYMVYANMRQRVQGRGTKSPWLYEGLECAWRTFAEFRAWALAAGFSKATPSPERLDTSLGYVPGNVIFVSKAHNCGTARGSAYYCHDAVRGEEPPP